MELAVFGWNITSTYRNGGAVFLRGLCRGLAGLGVKVTYVHHQDRSVPPDAMTPHPLARVVEYADRHSLERAFDLCSDADVIMKFIGLGEYDRLVEESVLRGCSGRKPVILVDGDAPDNLSEISGNVLHFRRRAIPEFDLVLVCNGGSKACGQYRRLGAKRTGMLMPAADLSVHKPSEPTDDLACDVLFMGNSHPDRDGRVEEFFFQTAVLRPEKRFVLAGAGWEVRSMPGNVKYVGHLATRDHSSAYSSARFVLNLTRDAMRRYGFCPSSRLFEAAASGACIITDPWPGLDSFFEPGREILIASSHRDLISYLDSFGQREARLMGFAARRRVLAEHTCGIRARELRAVIASLLDEPAKRCFAERRLAL